MVTGCTGLGLAVVAANNTVNNITSNTNTSNFFPHDLNLLDLFNLTGNDAIDLLLLVQYFQKLQIF